VSSSAGGERQSVATPAGNETMGLPTLQTLQDPILLLPWLCFRGGGFRNPTSTPSDVLKHPEETRPATKMLCVVWYSTAMASLV
jgi:hypothetical protein